MSGRATIRVDRWRSIPSPLGVEPRLPASTGVVVEVGEAARGFSTGTPVVLAGAPIEGDDTWHADRAVPVAINGEGRAGEIVLGAHLLYLLHRAGATGGDRVHVAALEPGRRILERIATAQGLVITAPGAARWIVLGGERVREAPSAIGAGLLLAGDVPSDLGVIAGPPPVDDPRTHYASGFAAWSLGRCLRVVRDRLVEDPGGGEMSDER